MPTPHGAFVWHELITSDPAAAKAFYTEVLGWGTQPGAGPIPYTMWTANGVALGGMMELTDEMKSARVPPHWTPFIGSRDVDATVEEAKKLGAKVLFGPDDIPNTGRFASLADPEGGVFAVYTASGDMHGPLGPSKPGEFSWHELAARDYKAEYDFYQQLFGWEKTAEHDMGPMGIYFMFGQNGETYGGMFSRTPEMKFPTHWLGYVSVADIHRTAEAVTKAGGTVMNGPMEVPDGSWIAQCMDPQGAAFAIHSPRK